VRRNKNELQSKKQWLLCLIQYGRTKTSGESRKYDNAKTLVKISNGNRHLRRKHNLCLKNQMVGIQVLECTKKLADDIFFIKQNS
jgi:hypothetical protein